ncbi:hypothetical protein AcW1_010042 [Taiwanofungus camphoratus]|nr:hypothetical protein AcV5_003128 [Antrodia cinnamomea]KAI0946620.1 hypothetical protein AcW1_010042 [Antrodia cinnamomea]
MLTVTPTFLKVPLILTGTIANHVASTSPHPPPKKEDRLRFGREDYITRISHWMPAMSKIVVWAIAMSEIGAIAASHYPSASSQSFLSHMIAGPVTSASSVRISRMFLVGWLLQSSGGLFRYLGRFFTFQLAVQDEHKLVTGGPYSIVRHPGYTGLLMVVVGMLTCQFGRGSWLAECGIIDTPVGKSCACVWVLNVCTILLSTLRRVSREDEVLRKEFGDQWVEWLKKTPYRLILGIY